MQSKSAQKDQKVFLLRIWHAFHPEKLQNVDGIKGNDLSPLPNTIDLPYKDILINDSKIAPEIFIYSGSNLSQKQKKMYEDLHEEAKKEGGELYVFDIQGLFDAKMGTDMADAKDFFTFYCQTNRSSVKLAKTSLLRTFKLWDNNDKKAINIDNHRFFILSGIKRIENKLKEKYQKDSGFEGLLYADFDKDVQPYLEDLAKNDHLPSFLMLHCDNLSHDAHGKAIRLSTTINLIYMPKSYEIDCSNMRHESVLLSEVNNFYKNLGGVAKGYSINIIPPSQDENKIWVAVAS